MSCQGHEDEKRQDLETQTCNQDVDSIIGFLLSVATRSDSTSSGLKKQRDKVGADEYNGICSWGE